MIVLYSLWQHFVMRVLCTQIGESSTLVSHLYHMLYIFVLDIDQMNPNVRGPLTLAAICKRKILLSEINDGLKKELRSLQIHVNELNDRQFRFQFEYDRIRRQQDRHIDHLQDQLSAKDQLVRQLQEFCDWWAFRWAALNNDRQQLLQENYLLRSHVQSLELCQSGQRSRSYKHEKSNFGDQK